MNGKCINCGKTRGFHKDGTMNCPIGKKTRVGYVSYSDKVYTPEKSDGSIQGLYEDAIRSTRRCFDDKIRLKEWRDTTVAMMRLMQVAKMTEKKRSEVKAYAMASFNHFVHEWSNQTILESMSKKQKRELEALFPSI